MRKIILAACAAVVLFGTQAAAAQKGAAPDDVSLLFLADPQVDNVHGTSLKQMFPFSDWVSKVAIRPPEVNLLAPLTLRYALTTGQSKLPEANNVVIVLGDGTNIGCSGEADVFDAQFLHGKPGTLRLMAHGNHDSYMMGTVNSYGPAGANTWTPGQMMTSDLPVDEAWWNPTDAPEVTGTSVTGRNWLDACYKPATAIGKAGTPMNKVRWLARYADSLNPHGLVQKPDGVESDDGLKFVGTATPGTALAALNYRSRGIWYRPKPGTSPDYARAWNSFVVQAFDVGDRHTVVLIDTSVCQNAIGGPQFLWTNAGEHSCIGKAQFEAIDALLAGIPADRNVIFGGHFPLKGLKRGERRKLVGIMKGRNPSGWTYVSAHTHDAMSDKSYSGGVDRNIGSTTDWPMESHVLRFDATSSRIVGQQSTVLRDEVKQLDYALDWDMAGKYSELCRHIGAAKALAEADASAYEARWVSPPMTEAACEAIQRNWAENAKALTGYQDRISERFEVDADYRRFILRVAVAASRYEAGQTRLGPRKIP
jgi:hypothetical protein